MLNLTKEEAIRNHREMWNWIADQNIKGYTGVWLKKQYLRNIGIDPFTVIARCFCCNYVRDNCDSNCSKCPLIWGEKLTDDCVNGIYGEWTREKDSFKAAQIAREIANLKER